MDEHDSWPIRLGVADAVQLWFGVGCRTEKDLKDPDPYATLVSILELLWQ